MKRRVISDSVLYGGSTVLPVNLLELKEYIC